VNENNLTQKFGIPDAKEAPEGAPFNDSDCARTKWLSGSLRP
jgi:hypothetical protein